MRNFFGLSPKYMQNIYKNFFYMKYYGGWSLFELYSLPIGLRDWYVQLLIDHKEEEREKTEEATQSTNYPPPSRTF